MKTAVIYNTIEKIWYGVEEGDWTKFQDVYINQVSETGQQEELQKELNDLLYGGEGDNEGKLQLNTVDLKEFAEAIRAGALVVECGFLP
jgi:hypothetical protein